MNSRFQRGITAFAAIGVMIAAVGFFPATKNNPFCVAESMMQSGDANADDELNIAKVVLLQKWLLAEPDVILDDWRTADYSGDGKLSATDLCLMKRMFLQKSVLQTDAIDIDLNAMSTSDTQSVSIAGNRITIMSPGTYHIFGTLTDGSLIVDAKKDSQVNLILDNAEITSSDYAPLYVKKSQCTTITLVDNTKSTLTNNGEYAMLDANNVDAVVFSKSDLVFDGYGALNVDSSFGNGITGKDTVVIKNGNYNIHASGHTLDVNDSLTIDGGTFALTAGKDAIHTENDDNPNLGIFTMDGGNITINSEDDAIHAVASLTINDGTLNIENCVEGLEAAKIHINGGDVYINTSEDAINATVGTEIECFNGEALIHFTGGKTEIVTKGDALDSNGDILIEGGYVICHGPGNTIFGFGALDYVNKAEITGGRFIALTSKGKAFSDTSTQPSFNLNLSDMITEAGFRLTDSVGNILVSENAKLPINAIIISIPELNIGEKYTAYVNDTQKTISQKALIVKLKMDI